MLCPYIHALCMNDGFIEHSRLCRLDGKERKGARALADSESLTRDTANTPSDTFAKTSYSYESKVRLGLQPCAPHGAGAVQVPSPHLLQSPRFGSLRSVVKPYEGECVLGGMGGV